MTTATEVLILGYNLGEAKIPPVLIPLLDEAVECYKTWHSNLSSVFVVGSVAVGEWKKGISDLDLVGVTSNAVAEEETQSRRQNLTALGKQWDAITFIDNAVIGKDEIERRDELPDVAGHLFKLGTTGVRLWGEDIDFRPYLPPKEEVARSRTKRAENLMIKYRSGNLIEAFREDPRLLTRSCAKAAMRVLSGTTLLRGADFYASPYQTATAVNLYTPEAIPIKDQAMAVIDNPNILPERAMEIVDKAVELFKTLFPDTEPAIPKQMQRPKDSC